MRTEARALVLSTVLFLNPAIGVLFSDRSSLRHPSPSSSWGLGFLLFGGRGERIGLTFLCYTEMVLLLFGGLRPRVLGMAHPPSLSPPLQYRNFPGMSPEFSRVRVRQSLVYFAWALPSAASPVLRCYDVMQ